MHSLSKPLIQSYRTNGYLVLPSGLRPADLEEIQAYTLKALDKEEARKASDPRFQNQIQYRRFTLGLHLGSPKIREYVQWEIFKNLGRAFIGAEVDLQFTSTITKSGEKNKSVDWHQDFAYDDEKSLDRMICWTSITASNPGNGGLSVLPGSHLRGPVAHGKSEVYDRDLKVLELDAAAALPVIMAAGDVMVIHPLLIHGSSENASGRDRIALIAGYRKPKSEYSEIESKIKMEILREV